MFRNRYYKIILIVGFILFIPLLAMQFTTEVNWGIMDFLIAACLLFTVIYFIDLTIRKTTNQTNRAMLIFALLILFVLVWAELAVGVFDNWSK